MAASKSSNANSNWYTLKKGQFIMWDKTNKVEEPFEEITGALIGISIIHDEGNGSVRPHDVILVRLKDEEFTECIKINLLTEAGIGLASRLYAVQKGSQLKLIAQGSKDNEKISFLVVRVLDEDTGEYVLPDREQWATADSGLSKASQHARMEETIRAHSTFHTGQPADESTEEEESSDPKGETASSAPAATEASTAKTGTPATGKTPSGKKNPVSAERDRYFDMIEDLGLTGLDVTDHRDMVARIMTKAEFGKVDPTTVKSFNDVDDRAVAWFTDWLSFMKEAISAGPSHKDFGKLPGAIKKLIEAKAAPIDDDPFEGE